MTCCEFQRRLSAYLDGELPRWTRWKIELHVRSCRECAQELRDLAMVDEYLAASVERTPAPEYLTGAVMHRLPAMPPARRTVRRWSPVMAATALAGAQLVALIGAYWVGFNRGAVQSSFFGPANGSARGVAAQPKVEPSDVRPATNELTGSDDISTHKVLFSHSDGRYGASSLNDVLESERRRREKQKQKAAGNAPKPTLSPFPNRFQPQGAH